MPGSLMANDLPLRTTGDQLKRSGEINKRRFLTRASCVVLSPDTVAAFGCGCCAARQLCPRPGSLV